MGKIDQLTNEYMKDKSRFSDEKLKSFVPDYRVNLLSPYRIDDFAKFRTEISEVFQFIKMFW